MRVYSLNAAVVRCQRVDSVDVALHSLDLSTVFFSSFL